jgi:hypothetical protein
VEFYLLLNSLSPFNDYAVNHFFRFNCLFNETVLMACVLVLTLYWPLAVTVVDNDDYCYYDGIRSFRWLAGCLLSDCVGGDRGGGCGICGGGSGGNVVSFHSCWLCNWPLSWSSST